MDPVGNQLDTAVQGPDNGGASGPSCQGGNLNAAVVPLVVPLEMLAWVQRMVLGVLVGPVA